MTREYIVQKIRDFMIDDMEIDESKLRPEATLTDDLDIDSLDLVDVVAFVYKTFGCKIEPEEIKKLVTLQDFCDYIVDKTK